MAAPRDLFGNPNPFPRGSLPCEHALGLSVAWTVGLLAVWRYHALER